MGPCQNDADGFCLVLGHFAVQPGSVNTALDCFSQSEQNKEGEELDGMELQSLEYFMAIAEFGSVSKAAEKFNISQPAMSRSLSKLEDELNAPLFDRIGKKLKLNARGEILLKAATGSIKMLDDASYQVRSLSTTPVGTVRFGAMAATNIISGCISAYTKLNPQVCFYTTTYYNSRSSDSNGFDVLLETHQERYNGYEFIPILHERHVAIMHKNHPFASRAWIDLEELKDDRFVFYPRQFSRTGFDNTYSYCLEAGFVPKHFIGTDNTSMKPEMVASGAAVGLVPEICIEGHARAYPMMAFVPIRTPNTERTVYLGWRSDGYLSEAARSFKEFAVKYFQDFARDHGMDS